MPGKSLSIFSGLYWWFSSHATWSVKKTHLKKQQIQVWVKKYHGEPVGSIPSRVFFRNKNHLPASPRDDGGRWWWGKLFCSNYPTIEAMRLMYFFVKWTTKKQGALLSMRGWWRGIFILVCYSPFYNWLVFHPLFTLNNQTRGPFFHCSNVHFSRLKSTMFYEENKACQVHVPPGININIAKKRWLVGGFNPVEQY